MIYLNLNTGKHVHQDCCADEKASHYLQTMTANIDHDCEGCGNPLRAHNNDDLEYISGVIGWGEYHRRCALQHRDTRLA